MQDGKIEAQKVLVDRDKRANETKNPLMSKFAATLSAHKFGILAWYDFRISTGIIEGFNNKINTMERQAYGQFFYLKIFSIHEKTTRSPDEHSFSHYITKITIPSSCYSCRENQIFCLRI
jgi:hypothetical protein